MIDNIYNYNSKSKIKKIKQRSLTNLLLNMKVSINIKD